MTRARTAPKVPSQVQPWSLQLHRVFRSRFVGGGQVKRFMRGCSDNNQAGGDSRPRPRRHSAPLPPLLTWIALLACTVHQHLRNASSDSHTASTASSRKPAAAAAPGCPGRGTPRIRRGTRLPPHPLTPHATSSSHSPCCLLPSHRHVRLGAPRCGGGVAASGSAALAAAAARRCRCWRCWRCSIPAGLAGPPPRQEQR